MTLDSVVVTLSFMKTRELVKELYDILAIDDFKQDISLNGLQIACSDKEIKKVAFAVDACKETLSRAAAWGADMLIVHHGLFWGKPIAIDGAHYDRVKLCFDNDMGLFAVHIPLDAHPLYGNNAQMALKLGMNSFDSFGSFRGMPCGFKGELPYEMGLEEVCFRLGFSFETGLHVLPFGKQMVKTVGIISGGAGWDVLDAIEEGLDLYITGEIPHEVYHTCEEEGISVIAGGHYRSEVFGVKALSRLLKGKYGIETEYFEVDTKL